MYSQLPMYGRAGMGPTANEARSYMCHISSLLRDVLLPEERR